LRYAFSSGYFSVPMKSKCLKARAMLGMSSASLRMPTFPSRAAQALSVPTSCISSTSSWFYSVMTQYQRSVSCGRSRSPMRAAALHPSFSPMLPVYVGSPARLRRAVSGARAAAWGGGLHTRRRCGGPVEYEQSAKNVMTLLCARVGRLQADGALSA
jgi:hypothetical protein